LPDSFAADPDRLRHFEQDARAGVAPSHPAILGVNDIGQHDGTRFMVCELLEGESLHAILSRGVLSHRRAIDYSIQVAHALSTAHSKDQRLRAFKRDTTAETMTAILHDDPPEARSPYITVDGTACGATIAFVSLTSTPSQECAEGAPQAVCALIPWACFGV